jgi:PIN domain nuclease of toxin-antitoxin system
MNYIADTHILLWSFFEPDRLSGNIKSILLSEENDIYYSPISLWEISIKYALKKLALNGLTPEEFLTELESGFFICKPVDNAVLVANYRLPILHRDPFDRFIIWDAICSGYTLLSADKSIASYESEGLRLVT